MEWQEVRKHFPHQWLLIEAIKAHSEGGKRFFDDIAVVDTFEDSTTALRRFSNIHRERPDREYFVLHTDKENLDIKEIRWVGIRPAYEDKH